MIKRRKPAPKRRQAKKSEHVVTQLMGRPPKYRNEFAEAAKTLCAVGATTADLAEFFEVTRQTVRNWMAAHPEFLAAIVISKKVADDRVKLSLYERAVGYTYDSEKIVVVKNKVVRVPIREHVPPDVNAERLWLMNRQPEEWRDKPEAGREVHVHFSPEISLMIARSKGLIEEGETGGAESGEA